MPDPAPPLDTTEAERLDSGAAGDSGRSAVAGLRLIEASYDHPDAVALTTAAQAYYVALYGGAGDTNPLAAAEFAPPSGRFLIGYAGPAAVAVGGWRFFAGVAPLAAQRPAEIRRMFVVDRLRGHGVGRWMLAALEASAVAAGVDVLVLETGSPQIEAVGLYRAAGYVDVPPFGYWADAPLAVHLGKRLVGGGQLVRAESCARP